MFFAWYSYDVFLSHAFEDKATIADEFCKRLKEEKLNVWYSGHDLKPGTDITPQVLAAIKKSRNGVFILSPRFIEKEWTKREYYVMQSREGKNETIIFPVLADVVPGDLAKMDPNLVDNYGLDMKKGLDEIVHKITTIIKARRLRRRVRLISLAGVIVAATFALAILTERNTATTDRATADTTSTFTKSLLGRVPPKPNSSEPPSNSIEKAIAKRVKDLETSIQRERAITANNGKVVTPKQLLGYIDEYRNANSHFRNEYDFNDGKGVIRTKKNVEKAIGFDPAAIRPGDEYTIKAAFIREANDKAPQEVSFTLENNAAIKWSIYKPAQNSIPYIIKVSYTNRLRLANIFLTYPLTTSSTRYNRVHLFGLPAEERYEFAPANGVWVLSKVN